MTNNSWNAVGPPDILPFGYGENTGGAYGRLRIQDAPDYLTNKPPFRGPGGTSPINRGGPNLPAFAPPLQATAGGVIPATTAWPGVTNQSAQQPGTPYAVQYNWAGTGYGEGGQYGLFDRFKRTDEEKAEAQAAREAKKAARELARYRDVAGANGYRYRQYANGDIEILAGPWGVGKLLTATNNPTKWRSVTAEIGPYKMAAGASEGLSTALLALAQMGQQVAPMLAPGSLEEEEEERPMLRAGIPTWGFVLGGVGILAAILTMGRRG